MIQGLLTRQILLASLMEDDICDNPDLINFINHLFLTGKRYIHWFYAFKNFSIYSHNMQNTISGYIHVLSASKPLSEDVYQVLGTSQLQGCSTKE